MASLTLEIIRYIIPVAGTVAGAFFGGYMSGKTQERILNTQLRSEANKELRKETLLTVQTYNQVLKLHGETSVIELDNRNGIESFNIEKYKLNIRPFLFEHLHVIDEKVTRIAFIIDENIRKADIFYMDPSEHEELIELYTYLIETIKDMHKEYRSNWMYKLIQ